MKVEEIVDRNIIIQAKIISHTLDCLIPGLFKHFSSGLRDNFSYYLLDNFSSPISGDVKTTLLLNLNPNPKDDVDIHTATIFESRQESSIFYQRQVDDVIVVNSNLKQGSNGAAHSGSDYLTMGYEK